MKIIGVTGKKYNGKDTLATYYINKHSFVPMAFARPLKTFLKDACHLNDDQLDGKLKEIVDDRWGKTPRKMMQDIGTAMRKIDDDFWIKSLVLKIANTKNDVIVTDIRYPNEADVIKKLGGTIIRVTRPSLLSNDTHDSEQYIDKLSVDYDVINDGTINELHAKADNLKLC